MVTASKEECVEGQRLGGCFDKLERHATTSWGIVKVGGKVRTAYEMGSGGGGRGGCNGEDGRAASGGG